MEANSIRAPASRAASSRLTVPRMLTSASAAGASTDARTSIWAARWQISSGPNPATTSFSAGGVGDAQLVQRDLRIQSPGPARRQVVQHDHVVSPGQQGVHDMGTDETGAAGHKYAHT